MSDNNDFIAEVLVGVGLISDQDAALAVQAAETGGSNIVNGIVDSGLASELDVLKALANQFGMETISLTNLEIPDDVIDMMSAEIVRRYKVIPVYRHDGLLGVALGDPLDVQTLDSLRFALKLDIQGVVALPAEIEAAINHYYSMTESSVEAVLSEMSEGAVTLSDASEGAQVEDQGVSDTDAPIIKLVSLIILEAFRSRGSDIHIEPMEKKFRVRYRIDGVLHEVESPPRKLQSAIISRIKIMSNMSIAEKRIPQDGRIEINVMDRDLDLRVSAVPTNHGESIVMRILDKESLDLGLGQLGFFSDDQTLFEKLTSLPDGIFLVTGPTGSGKTTTLYACLNQLNRPDRKIITVEDPVEYQLSGVNQVHVRSEIGLTFSAALRSMLRQAPNIVMIGEIRDMETAEIAINASLTGHLVLSTLHTNDAPGAVTRLIDIGVKPFLVASSCNGLMAQRLVRTICDQCKEAYIPEERELALLGPRAEEFSDKELYRGVGCAACSMTGYRGRKGIFEICEVDDEIRHMIYRRMTTSELRNKARELGMRTLREDGLRKVSSGMTTLEEVFRVTMGDSE